MCGVCLVWCVIQYPGTAIAVAVDDMMSARVAEAVMTVQLCVLCVPCVGGMPIP